MKWGSPLCSWCDGTGWINFAGKVRSCFVCKGSGKA